MSVEICQFLWYKYSHFGQFQATTRTSGHMELAQTLPSSPGRRPWLSTCRWACGCGWVTVRRHVGDASHVDARVSPGGHRWMRGEREGVDGRCGGSLIS